MTAQHHLHSLLRLVFSRDGSHVSVALLWIPLSSKRPTLPCLSLAYPTLTQFRRNLTLLLSLETLIVEVLKCRVRHWVCRWCWYTGLRMSCSFRGEHTDFFVSYCCVSGQGRADRPGGPEGMLPFLTRRAWKNNRRNQDQWPNGLQPFLRKTDLSNQSNPETHTAKSGSGAGLTTRGPAGQEVLLQPKR